MTAFNRTGLSLLLMLSATAGCEGIHKSPAGESDPLPPLKANVVRVSTMSSRDGGWISFDPTRPDDPEGFRLTVMLQDETFKAVRGDGLIRVEMFRIVREDDQQHLSRELAFRWEFPPDKAVGFQVRKKNAYGWPYGLRLNWGKTDVAGQEIQVVASFIRKDGHIISSRPITMIVPESKNRPPTRPNSDKI